MTTGRDSIERPAYEGGPEMDEQRIAVGADHLEGHRLFELRRSRRRGEQVLRSLRSRCWRRAPPTAPVPLVPRGRPSEVPIIAPCPGHRVGSRSIQAGLLGSVRMRRKPRYRCGVEGSRRALRQVALSASYIRRVPPPAGVSATPGPPHLPSVHLQCHEAGLTPAVSTPQGRELDANHGDFERRHGWTLS